LPEYTNFNFFPEQRRKLELTSWQELMNAQSEKRIRLDLQMPLTNQTLLGMPDFIGRGFEIMEREDSHEKQIPIDVELENVHFEAFSTDVCKKAIPIESLGLNLDDEKKQLTRSYLKFSSSTIRNFKLVRIKDGVALEFNITVKSDAGLCLWAHHYHGATFWGVFSEAQLVVPKKDENQMELGDQPAETTPSNGSAKGVAKVSCPAIDNNGGHCVLDWNHEEPEHVFSNGKPVDLKSKSNGKGKRVN
jgi:hypothetical protein